MMSAALRNELADRGIPDHSDTAHWAQFYSSAGLNYPPAEAVDKAIRHVAKQQLPAASLDPTDPT